jgi:hypothetical protein
MRFSHGDLRRAYSAVNQSINGKAGNSDFGTAPERHYSRLPRVERLLLQIRLPVQHHSNRRRRPLALPR